MMIESHAESVERVQRPLWFNRGTYKLKLRRRLTLGQQQSVTSSSPGLLLSARRHRSELRMEHETDAKRYLQHQCYKVPLREAELRDERDEKDNSYECLGANGSVGHDEEPDR